MSLTDMAFRTRVDIAVRELSETLEAAYADGRADCVRASLDGDACLISEGYCLLPALVPIIVAELRLQRRL